MDHVVPQIEYQLFFKRTRFPEVQPRQSGSRYVGKLIVQSRAGIFLHYGFSSQSWCEELNSDENGWGKKERKKGGRAECLVEGGGVNAHCARARAEEKP